MLLLVGIMERKFVGVIHSGASAAVSRSGLNITKVIADARGDGLVLFASDGPLVTTAKERALQCRVVRRGGFTSGIFRDAVNAASAELEELQPTVLYVNSCAASAWALAGKQLGLKVIFHVYELDRELVAQLHGGATCIDICAAADIVVVSDKAIVSSLRRCLGYVPEDVIDVGVLLDGAEIVARASLQAPPARWLFGRDYERSARKLVTMWGTACFRNGIDIFLEMARRLPAHDFLWIGAWTMDANETLSARGIIPQNFDNFYCAEEIDNPYPLISMADLFVLTTREAENPFDLVELAALRTRIVCFSESLENWKVAPNAFYVLFGAPSVDRLVAFVSLCLGSNAGISRGTGQVLFPRFYGQTNSAHLLDELRRRMLL
jgi:hypothetical protein